MKSKFMGAIAIGSVLTACASAKVPVAETAQTNQPAARVPAGVMTPSQYTSISFKKNLDFAPTPGTYNFASPSHGQLASVFFQKKKIVKQPDAGKPWCWLIFGDNFKYWYQMSIPKNESFEILGLGFDGRAFLGNSTDSNTPSSGSFDCNDGNLVNVAIDSEEAKKAYGNLVELK